jgi:hypothetical protein
VEGGGTVSPAGDRKPFGDEVILLDLDTGVTARSPGSPERHLTFVLVIHSGVVTTTTWSVSSVSSTRRSC